MSSPENRQQTFPATPLSRSAGDHDMRDYYVDPSAPRPSPNQTPYLTPYLGLRARLSQIWINRWTVLLLLVLIRTLFAISSMDRGLTSARADALRACTNVEKIGSAMASMPHFMSQGVNRMTAHGVEKAVNGLMDMVGLSITGVEEVVVFVIGLMTNTYLCLITLAVSGSLSAAVEVVQKAQDELNKVLGRIGDEVNKAGADVQNGINGLVSGINTFLGADLPKIDFTKQVDELKNLKLPNGLTEDLKKLNDSVPTFEEVKKATEGVIRLPFEELKKVVEESMGNYTFDRSVFPVPQREKLSFCSDSNGINDFFDDLQDIAHVARNVFIGVLLTAAILACVPMAWYEIKRYRRLQERAKNIGNEAVDPMDAVYMASRPFTSGLGRKIASRFSTPRRRILVRWAVAYPTSVPALFILSLAAAGLFACLCQYILLVSLEKEVPALTDQVADFTGNVVQKLSNASVQWADGSNKAILAESNKLNEDLLGWVGTSSKAVNDTLNKFVDETTSVLDKAFGGTPLEGPIKGVFKCLVEIKVQGVQRGLTWVRDNAHINFPLLPNDTFSLDAVAKMTDSDSDDNFLANPTDAASDDITGAVLKVTGAIRRGIKQEAIIATMILVVWLLTVLMSAGYTTARFAGYDRVRGDAGNEADYDVREIIDNNDSSSVGNNAFVVPTRPLSAAPPYEKTNPDVSAHAPYALNPHPFPRRRGDDEETGGMRGPGASAWNGRTHPEEYASSSQARYNEKSGFI